MSRSRRFQNLPPRLEAGRQRFERWRGQHTGRARIPPTLWCTAVKLAEEFGVHRTAKVLRLNYEALKTRVNAVRCEPSSAELPATFVELIAGTSPGAGQCVVELDDGRGASMRIRLEQAEATILAALTRAFVRGTR